MKTRYYKVTAVVLFAVSAGLLFVNSFFTDSECIDFANYKKKLEIFVEGSKVQINIYKSSQTDLNKFTDDVDKRLFVMHERCKILSKCSRFRIGPPNETCQVEYDDYVRVSDAVMESMEDIDRIEKGTAKYNKKKEDLRVAIQNSSGATSGHLLPLQYQVKQAETELHSIISEARKRAERPYDHPARLDTSSENICHELIERTTNNQAIYDIVETAFNSIYDLPYDVLPDSFLSSEPMGFAICNNRNYSVVTRYSNPPSVIFDFQFIAFIFAQSRSFILGQYIAEHLGDGLPTTELHKSVISRVASQSDSLEHGLDLVDSSAKDLGVDDNFLKNTLNNEDYQNRERLLFLQALFFVSLHERCHAFLNHGPRGDGGNRAGGYGLVDVKRELEADKCAISIINKNEMRDNSSPISLIASLLTLSAQLVIEHVARDYHLQGHHSSAVPRLENATKLADDLVLSLRGTEMGDRYADFVNGMSEYFLSLSEHLDSFQKMNRPGFPGDYTR